MRLTFGKRVLMFFHWLLTLMICVAFALSLIVPYFFADCRASIERTLGPVGIKIAGVALLVIYLGLAVFQLLVILNIRKRTEKGFVNIASGETDGTRIAVTAVEQMVRQSVQGIDGISDMQIDIEGLKDAIAIVVNATIVSGSHIPTVTTNMQRAIRQFVENHCGVPVQSVSVSINAVSGQPDRRSRGRSKATEVGRAMEENKQTNVAYESAVPEATVIPQGIDETTVSAPAPSATFEAEPAQVMPEAAGNDADEAEAAEVSPEAPKAAAFDLDKPYESEFAKDLAAMKAREAADNGGEGL